MNNLYITWYLQLFIFGLVFWCSCVLSRFTASTRLSSRATGGTGLGLAIVRTIVERNRGDIEVSSVMGQGTTFTVTFPAFDTEVDPE